MHPLGPRSAERLAQRSLFLIANVKNGSVVKKQIDTRHFHFHFHFHKPFLLPLINATISCGVLFGIDENAVIGIEGSAA